MPENPKKYITEIIETHRNMITQLQTSGMDKLIAVSEMITEAIKKDGCIYVCGNGGSAADAQHISSELVGRFEKDRKALPAVALTTDTSILTSVSNDYGCDNMFSRQVEALVNKGDILWAISTSGDSANIIAAAESAKQKGAKILAFTGRSNSKLEQIADICFCANNDSTARSQEIHQIAYHIICGLVEASLANTKN